MAVRPCIGAVIEADRAIGATGVCPGIGFLQTGVPDIHRERRRPSAIGTRPG